MKKFISLLLVLCCVLSLCACAPKIINPETGDDYEVNINLDKDMTATLEILVPNTDGGKEGRIIDALAKGFKQLYPNVTIKKYADMISDEMYMDTITTLVQSETLPDLVFTNTALYYYLVSKKVVINLEPYYSAVTKANVLDWTDYYEDYLYMASYENKRYIVPRNADTVVTFFNVSMLEEAGIKTSGADKDSRLNNDWTWDNFISICEDLVSFWDKDRTKYANYYCMRQTVYDWESVWNPMMQSVGANAYTDGKVSIDSENTNTFVSMLKELVDKKIVPSWNSGSSSTFMNGKAAFEFASSGPVDIQGEKVMGNFDMLPFPLIGDNGKIGTGFAGWGISSTSKNRDLAWAFLQYLISEEGQLTLAASGESTTPSLLRDITESKDWAKKYKDLNLDAYMAHQDNKIIPQYFKGFDPSHMFDIQYALQEFVRNSLTTTFTVDQAIEQAAKKLTDAIKEI